MLGSGEGDDVVIAVTDSNGKRGGTTAGLREGHGVRHDGC